MNNSAIVGAGLHFILVVATSSRLHGSDGPIALIGSEPMSGATPGEYSIRWRAAGADGQLATDLFSFVVS